jgi:hypothetical protein
MGSQVEELACRQNLSRPLCGPGLFWIGLSVPFKHKEEFCLDGHATNKEV